MDTSDSVYLICRWNIHLHPIGYKGDIMGILYRYRTVVILLILVLLVNITGCGNFKDEQRKINKSENDFGGKILGTWIVNPGVRENNGLLNICVLDPDDRTVEIIFSDYTGVDLEGAISPDGQKLAINLWDLKTDSLNLYIYDMETKKLKRLSDEYGEEREFSWFPDGEHLVYQHIGHLPQQGDGSNIIKINVNTGQKSELGVRVPNVRSKEFWYDSPRVTPDGKKIIYTKGSAEGYFGQGPGKRTFQNGLYIMNADGSQEQLLYMPKKGTISRISLAPDGTKVVFNIYEVLGNLNFPSEIWIYDLVSQQANLVLPNSEKYYQNAYPVFSRDGESIIFLSASYQEQTIPPNNFHLYKMDLESGKIEPLEVFYKNREVCLSKMSLIP